MTYWATVAWSAWRPSAPNVAGRPSAEGQHERLAAGCGAQGRGLHTAAHLATRRRAGLAPRRRHPDGGPVCAAQAPTSRHSRFRARTSPGGLVPKASYVEINARLVCSFADLHINGGRGFLVSVSSSLLGAVLSFTPSERRLVLGSIRGPLVYQGCGCFSWGQRGSRWTHARDSEGPGRLCCPDPSQARVSWERLGTEAEPSGPPTLRCWVNTLSPRSCSFLISTMEHASLTSPLTHVLR